MPCLVRVSRPCSALRRRRNSWRRACITTFLYIAVGYRSALIVRRLETGSGAAGGTGNGIGIRAEDTYAQREDHLHRRRTSIWRQPEGRLVDRNQPEDSIHALIAVHTDAGVTGHGSVFADGGLGTGSDQGDRVRSLKGENALEPERVSEKLHQNTFWMGRGGTLTHAISGIDIALWDILGKVTGQPVGRLLGGVYRRRVQPYCSLLMEEPARMADTLRAFQARGFRAFKIGWGPFGRAMDAKLDEAIVRAAREAIGPDAKLFVDAGASDAYWPHGLKWAMRTAEMLKDYEVGWFEEALAAGRIRRLLRAAPREPGADRRRARC